MEARLAAYRAEKRKVAEKTERREFWLNIFTLAPLRQRLAALVVPDRINSQASSVSITLPQTNRDFLQTSAEVQKITGAKSLDFFPPAE